METTVGARIRRFRTAKKMSLDQLAQAAKVSKAYLSQLENGDSTRPAAEILYNIALCLDTSIASLLGKVQPKEIENSENQIPSSLNLAAVEYGIDNKYVKMLAVMSMRGGKKKNEYSKHDWVHLYETIRLIEKSKKN